MISVTEAKEIIKSKIGRLTSIIKPIDEAVGFILDQDIFSQINVPSFVQSSMDGYAFAFESIKHFSVLEITELIQAGASKQSVISKNNAVRIFTGAPLPEGADTVLMQEKAIIENGALVVAGLEIEKGLNARPIGADIQKGALALQKGTLLTPASIGFLASIGICEVAVIKKPTVQIILTGNELQALGNELNFGQIYESNSHTLKAALHQVGMHDVEIKSVEDDLNAITNAVRKALEKFDLILMTGGVSVGDYDFVLKATKANNIDQLFHKIKQKPGKPLYLGMNGEKVICGLPGNPSSVLSCFYNYVLLVLDQLSGTQLLLPQVKAIVSNDYKKPIGLTHFLKGKFEMIEELNNTNPYYQVTILDGQESFKMNSFALANCFIELPEEATVVNAGEEVLLTLFPR
jgi:molybdopterin molybdotransferase